MDSKIQSTDEPESTGKLIIMFIAKNTYTNVYIKFDKCLISVNE